MTEPLLIAYRNRFTLFPVKYHDIFHMYKLQQSARWTVEEIDLAADIDDWAKLTADEQHFIKNVLAFFAASDGIVNENINNNFADEVKWPEARAFYTEQAAIETVHSETYSLLIDTYIRDDAEKDGLFNAVETSPAIKRKAEWAFKYMNRERSFAERLVAFSIIEGLFFSGAFCAIYWLKKRGLMPGLTFSNELISKDESLHAEFACLLYQYVVNRLDVAEITKIMRDAVEIESEFINESLPCRLLGMNAELMTQYIQFVADRLMVQLGYDRIYNVNNPFDWMETISLQSKTNFFEKRVGNYSKAQLFTPGEKVKLEFNMDDDF